jgi:hypothetical protein
LATPTDRRFINSRARESHHRLQSTPATPCGENRDNHTGELGPSRTGHTIRQKGARRRRPQQTPPMGPACQTERPTRWTRVGNPRHFRIFKMGRRRGFTCNLSNLYTRSDRRLATTHTPNSTCATRPANNQTDAQATFAVNLEPHHSLVKEPAFPSENFA